MGWIFGYKSPTEIKNDLNASRGSLKILAQASTSYGRHLWTVYETPQGKRFVQLDLIEKNGSDWGYKNMSEDMGPCYFDCPLSLLDLAGPTDSHWAIAWRQKVREHHVRRSATYKTGDEVLIYGKRYVVERREKRSFIVRSIDTGRIYKTSSNKMIAAPPVAD